MIDETPKSTLLKQKRGMQLKKIRKINKKIIDELLSLRESRGAIEDFSMSFLLNFAENCRLMHSLISTKDKKIDIYKTAYRQYFVFLISCWETYFRDVFVFVDSVDESRITTLLSKMRTETSININTEINLSELLSKSFNFQNLNDLEEAYNGMWGESFLNYICTTNISPCGLSGQISQDLSIENIFPDWRALIEEAFYIRHKVVHDANFRPKVNIELISKVEALFLIIPQFATHIISERFNLKKIVISDGKNNHTYIFNISDILSDDWVVS